MKRGGAASLLKRMCWAAAGLAVLAAGAKELPEGDAPPSEARAGRHEHAPHRRARHAPPAPDGHQGLSPRAVQHEVEQMAMRASRLAAKDQAAATKVEAGLEAVEAALATRVGDDAALADEIRAVRAELCAKEGFPSHRGAECEAFMRSSCLPGAAGQADDEAGPADEAGAAPDGLAVPAALCQRYWGKQAAGPAPAPAEAAAAAPAPAPAPASMDDFSGRSLPEQGFQGELVGHADQDTQTADWQGEFGPRAGHRNYREICAEHPDNRWCQMHLRYTGDLPSGWGPRPRPERSGAAAPRPAGRAAAALATAAAAAAAAMLLGGAASAA